MNPPRSLLAVGREYGNIVYYRHNPVEYIPYSLLTLRRTYDFETPPTHSTERVVVVMEAVVSPGTVSVQGLGLGFRIGV